MSTIKTAVICAAGMGTRLGLNMPKCLVEINQKKIIEYQLELLEDIENVIIVVGFMEDRVIEEVTKYRKNVIFVRNPKYHETTNAYSLYLGTYFLREAYLMLDGDLIVEKSSFNEFIQAYKYNQSLIGLVESSTEEAVFTEIDEEKHQIISFSRKPISNYEWSGLAIFNNQIKISQDGGFVYSELEKYLPLQSKIVEAMEIDTPNDLELAKQKITTWKKSI